MPRAHASQAARNDLAPLGNEPLQQTNVAVRDRVDLLRAELADLLAPEELASARSAAWCAGRTWSAWTGTRAGMTGVTGVAAARAGCRCVLLGRVRAVDLVSHSS